MAQRSPELPDARDFLHRFVTTAQGAGFVVENFGEAPGGAPMIVAWRRPESPVLSVCVSAGIHGDEPAGPLALLHWLARGSPDPGVAWTIFPLMNPTGWDAGTRENSAGCDLNRDYFRLSQPEVRTQVEWLERREARFDWGVCLHEDWESTGFYLYEVRGADAPGIGRAILGAVESVMPPELSPEIDGMPAVRGLITPSGDLSRRGEAWPEALRMIRLHAPLCHTFESPSALPLSARMAALLAGLRAGLAELLRPRVEDDFVI